jgi:uncharacterized membrane protein YphA (DoxX/SURF4 family)
MRNSKIIPLLLAAARLILGMVFIFSGFVKGVDPLGSAYKFSDYFSAFNMGFLDPLAIILAIVLSAVEFLIGISLLFSFRFRLGAWAVSIFMVFFTILTFILALTNPVTDCGCFGDAIIMTNWQTFFKNLILLPFVFIVFRFRGEQAETMPGIFSWIGLAVFAVLFLALEVSAVRHLPVLDFRPYGVGTYIPEKMSIPEGAPQDEYLTVLYYEKDGEVKEFTEENFPWEDTTWKFVDTEHKLISKGYEPPIHDLNVVDEENYDHINDILEDEGFSLLLVSTDIGKADKEALRAADELASWCLAKGHSFYFMTSSVDGEINRISQELDLGFSVYTTDEITLKTIIRSNPGLLIIRGGTILGKWHYNDMPGIEELEAGIMRFVLSSHRLELEKRSLGIFIALFLVISVIIMYSPVRRNFRK